MIIEYRLVAEDWDAHADRYLATVPPRITLWVGRLSVILMAAILLLRSDGATRIRFLPVVAVLVFLLCGLILPRMQRSGLRRRFREQSDRHGLDRMTHRIEAAPDGLHAWSELEDVRLPWEEVTLIEEGPDDAFLFRINGPSYFIPRARIVSGDLGAFLEEARRRRSSARREDVRQVDAG